MNKSVDFSRIWDQQSISEQMEKALAHVAKVVHDILVEPPSGIRNVTEWAKKQACWERVKVLEVEWPSRRRHQESDGEGRSKRF